MSEEEAGEERPRREYSYRGPDWLEQVKVYGSQIEQLRKSFNDYITPDYVVPEKSERSIQLRLYTLTKRQFLIVFSSLFILFGLSVLIGIAGPPIVSSSVSNATDLLDGKKQLESQNGHFVMYTPSLSKFNQQLWVQSKFYRKNKRANEEYTTMKLLLNVIIQARAEDTSFSSVQATVYNHSRELKCHKEECDEFTILHLSYLDYSSYMITIDFYSLDSIQPGVAEIFFIFSMYNPSFTKLEIWFRFSLLFTTFIVTCLYAHNLRLFTMRDWSTEQRWLALLLPLLLLYNDPLFPLTFLINSWLPGMLDSLFQDTFLSTLLLFWLCSFHAIRQVGKKMFCLFYLPKLVIVGTLWLTALILAVWQQWHELKDPTYQLKVDTDSFNGLKIFFFVIGGLYTLYLIFLVVRAFTEFSSSPYFGVRLKFLTALMTIVVIISFTIMVLRFGTGILQPNFIPELSTRYSNSVEFIAFYSLLNLYLYSMAYVYSPSKSALLESHINDGATFAMLQQESDEDVIYGSDNDEHIRLNGSTNTTNHGDDNEDENSF